MTKAVRTERIDSLRFTPKSWNISGTLFSVEFVPVAKAGEVNPPNFYIERAMIRAPGPSAANSIEKALERASVFELVAHHDVSDIDIARTLLADGNNRAAIAKALDIIERLDK